MMGMAAAPARLLYDFCLDCHLPTDHFLDFGGVRAELKPFYSTIGRPLVAPGC
jgi:hypothetical protein